ncbi:uncharacterized protein [Littorina saxatilis]|uniref:Uncharacterized protein n=1 Tax=Littorina saxatilis TaxID=31220 RepID=A0AAN9B5R8_9CAEN
MPHGAIPFPFGKCRICCDKATGVHYGVATCEGCKGFYKRSIPKGEKYRCYFGGTCVISPENRNRCKSCRFRKCLEQGMAMEAVKMGRIPKVEKERALEEVATLKSDVDDVSSMSPPTTAVTGPQANTQTTANGSAERGKRLASGGHPFDEDLGSPPWDLPHGDSAHRFPRPHKKFINSSFPSAHSSSSSSMYGHDPNRFSTPIDAAFHRTGSSGHSSDTSSGFSSHSSFGTEESSMSLDWYKKDTAANREEKPLMLSSESDLGPFEKLMMASEAARNQNMELHNGQLWTEDRDGSPHGREFSTAARTFDGVSSEMDASQPGTEDGDFQANPGASPQLLALDRESPKSSGTSSPESGVRGQRKLYSPGLIKVLFNQVMQGENGQQRDKLLKKLARTCSQEAFGSSGLELLHSVVSSSMAINRGGSKTASAPDIRSAFLQASTGQASSCANTTVTASPSPSFAASSPAVSHTSYSVSSHTTHGQLSLDSFDGGSSLLSQKHGFGSSGKGGMHQGGSSEVSHQPWSQSPHYHHQEEQGSHAAQYSQCHPQSNSLSQSHNQQYHPQSDSLSQSQDQQYHPQSDSLSQSHSSQFFKELFPSSHSFSAGDMHNIGHSHLTGDSQHPPLAPPSQHSPPLEFHQSHPQQTFSEGMEGSHFQSVENPLAVPPSDSGECGFDLNYLCQEQLRDIHESHMQSDANSPVSSHEGSLVNLAPGYSEHNMKDFATARQLIEGHINDGMTPLCFNGPQGKDTATSACYDDEPKDKEFAAPTYFSDPLMKEAAEVLGSGICKIFECEMRRAFRDQHLKLMREDPTLTIPPTVKHFADIYPLLMKSLPVLNKKIINFCQLAPGFSKLNVLDQKSLLKRGYYDIWMLTNSEFFVDGESYLLVTEDPIFYIRRDMESIIGKENAKTLHCFAQQFNALGLSDLEVAILCCIQLTAPGHDQQADLKDVKEIQKLNSFYLDLLVAVVTDIHGDSCSRVLIDIFRLVPLLGEINRLQRELIGNFSVNGPPGLMEAQDAETAVKEESV